MSKKDKALKLALEALENGRRVRSAEGGTKYQPDLENAAITAIRAALAQQQEPAKACVTGQCPCKSECDSAQCCLYTSPQPASKPWVGLTRPERFEIEQAMSKYYDYRHECKTVCLPEFAAAIEAKLREKNAQPSKPLTNEQIEQCMKQAYATVQGRNLEHAFARAIEQAHGITGGQK